MILNQFEETTIKNKSLPPSWKSQRKLDELEDFLQHNWDQRRILYDDGRPNTQQQFLSFLAKKGIRTNNYIGSIAFAGEQMNIYPKIFRTAKGDHDTGKLTQNHLIKNLIYWLEYCNKISYHFIEISSDLKDAENFRDLFLTLYVGYVRLAIKRNLFYQYVEETEALSYIKGKFDFSDYIVRKIPNGMTNKFRCSYSTFKFDNWVNRIIKYTCKQIINSTSKKNQKIIRYILVKLNDVSDVQCSPSDCDRVHLSKMHSNYRIILNMSKMLLLNKTSGLKSDINESFCFLFPTELLFQGFIGGFIKEVIENKYEGRVYLQRSNMKLINDIQYAGHSLGPAFTMRHDILVELHGKIFILDTKYTQMTRFEGDLGKVWKIVSEEPEQKDLYQICEYARMRNISDVYLLYPMYRYESNEPYYPVGQSRSENGNINIHFIRLPFIIEENADYIKAQIIDVIKYIFNI